MMGSELGRRAGPNNEEGFEGVWAGELILQLGGREEIDDAW